MLYFMCQFETEGGETLRTIASERVLKGWTQRELAERLGCTQTSVCLWENGAVIPSAATVVKMAKLFGCTTDYLLGVTENRL